MSGPPSDIDAIKARVIAQYPTLEPTVNALRVIWGKSPVADGRKLEFYPPWESDNPMPGGPTLELFKPQMQGNALRDAIAGDSLHYLGAIDPRTGKPIDEQWMGMKRALRQSLTPEQLAVDRRAYEEAKANGDNRPFEDWMQDSRTDAYIRGYITPDADNNWRDVYNPAQKSLLSGMKNYLRQGMKPDMLGVIGNRGIWDTTNAP